MVGGGDDPPPSTRPTPPRLSFLPSSCRLCGGRLTAGPPGAMWEWWGPPFPGGPPWLGLPHPAGWSVCRVPVYRHLWLNWPKMAENGRKMAENEKICPNFVDFGRWWRTAPRGRVCRSVGSNFFLQLELPITFLDGQKYQKMCEFAQCLWMCEFVSD